jgi:preprotein translocase subunit Sss1
MKIDVKQVFHMVSYLQYPLAILGLVFVIKPYITGFEVYRDNLSLLFKDLNSVLILMGLAISFSTLQDTTKTQNKISLRVWQDPLKGKIFLAVLSVFILGLIIIGMIGYFGTANTYLKELSIGIIILGIGLIGMLKTGIEMFENHRKDKNLRS